MSNRTNWGFRAAIHVFRPNFRKERDKWPQNTFWSVKIGEKKFGKWRQRWKMPVFDMFYRISQSFLRIMTWNYVYIFIIQCPLTYSTFFYFKNLDFELKYFFFKIKIVLYFFWKFSKFWFFETPISQFCSSTNSTSYHMRTLIVA